MTEAAQWMRTGGDESSLPTDLHTERPHPARMYDYFLGGKDNFPADRAAAERAAAGWPNVRKATLENRRFLGRAVRYLAAEAGVRQFLDIGTGIPTANNTHEVAQSVAPDSRVVYVDNDPIVLAHARALLVSTPQGMTSYLDADLRDPEKILEHPDLRSVLDFRQPIALMLIAILHFLPDDQDPYGIVRRLVSSLPSGSYLALTQVTGDFDPFETGRLVQSYRESGVQLQARTHAEVERFFDGLDIVEPGIEVVSEWRPDAAQVERFSRREVSVYGAVARVR
ncbi:SAM-dependent methyltransferase [Kitasatospora mediocidica]|uniref:SAM-dependent methyltransferase n=1 Tax=Kitasatospora mediocidica TaxID=58352 RepID=UPI0005689614|nr:SAM-dependent methyltransferase [Kitasatospora mediocidica]